MEIILGKERKRWSQDQKREIVAETLAPGETVTGVARRHGANPSMVFSWRKQLAEQQTVEAPQTAFMPVALAPPAVSELKAMEATATIDLTFACGARLKLTGAVDPELAAGIVKALRRA